MYHTSIHSEEVNSSALMAIANAPSAVLLPPMNPDACTKVHWGTPDRVFSASSRTPRHGSGRDRRFSKLVEDADTHCTLKSPGPDS